MLAGTGLIKAFLAVAVKIWPDFAATGAYAILFSAADAVFQFLPILLAITAAKKFKANVYTSVAIAGALIYSSTIAVIPGADGVTTTLQRLRRLRRRADLLRHPGDHDQLPVRGHPDHPRGVGPVPAWRSVLNRGIPETFRNFVVPMLTILVIVPLTFIVIGPIADWVGTTMSDAINSVWNLSPAVGGAIMGAFWQVFVIFGDPLGLRPGHRPGPVRATATR